MKSVVEQIFIYASRFPDKIALIEGEKSVTYGELVSNILLYNKILLDTFHVKDRDRIILAANKQLCFIYAYFAAHLSGIITVPVDGETNTARLNFIIDKTAPPLIIGLGNCDENFRTIGYNAFDIVFEHENMRTYNFPPLDAVADIIFTSGTTGEPKGVILTHRNIASSAFNINTFIRNTVDDVELLALPVSHSFGLGRLRCVLSKGATLVIMTSFANVKRFFRLIEKHKVSGLAMVPASWTFLKKMSGSKLGEYSSQLNYIEIGSAPMPVEEKKLLMELFPQTRICMHYGLTEASRATFIEFHSDFDKLDSVGKASPNVSVAIKDEKGKNLPDSTEGEICIEGSIVTTGYWNDDSGSSQAFWGKYFRTGDWGIMDCEGYTVLKSRKKELINVGGKKVSPVEVENVLLAIDGISECACTGIDDPNGVLGEVVKAFLVKKQGSQLTVDEIRDKVKGKLETYKLPVEYEWIKTVPKTPSGKIQRLLLN
jgi:long-chain acyl-CoA synthetase